MLYEVMLCFVGVPSYKFCDLMQDPINSVTFQFFCECKIQMRNMDGVPMKKAKTEEEESELRRGPWTLEEDRVLIYYIARHGEGRWNMLARCSGLKRTGKSCRLRWLNYLKPDVKRGNLTPEEQLLILELHSKWGNRWSRIARHLPGRTDNEIKNYWRTRVQKQARQLQCDANSQRFRETVRCYWMPRLLQKMNPATSVSVDGNSAASSSPQIIETPQPSSSSSLTNMSHDTISLSHEQVPNVENYYNTNFQLPTISEFPTSPYGSVLEKNPYSADDPYDLLMNTMLTPGWNHATSDFSVAEHNWVGDISYGLWNMDDFMLVTQRQSIIK